MKAILKALQPENTWDVAYPLVSKIAQRHLDDHPGVTFTNADLGQVLLPASLHSDPAYRHARQRLFKALRACADHGLKEYVSKVEVRSPWTGKKCQSLRWAAPL